MSINISTPNYATRNHTTGNTFLLANTGQKVTETFDFTCEFQFESTLNEQILFVSPAEIRLLGGTWEQKGVVVGDTLQFFGTISSNGATLDFSGTSRTVTNVTGDTFTVNLTLDPGLTGLVAGQPMPLQAGPDSNSALSIVNLSRTEPEAVDILHNLCLNASSGSAASLFDGEINRFEVVGVDSMSVSDVLAMTQLGYRSGGSYDSVTLERLADVPATNWIVSTLSVVKYRATFIWANSLKFQDSTFDEPTWFAGIGSVKPYYRVRALPQQNNPNSALETEYSQQLGNVGWRDESYNQGINEFTEVSISIENSQGDSLSEVDFSQTNVVTATISHPTANFLEFAEVEFFLIPDIETIQNRPERHADLIQLSNFTVDAAPAVEESVYGIGGAEMQTSTQTLDVSTAAQIVVQFTLEPNAAFTALIESVASLSRRYVITATVESAGGTANTNNAVPLTLKEGILEKQPLVGEPYPAKFQGFYNHANLVTGVSEPSYNGCTEDDFVYKALFDLQLGDIWAGLNLRVQVVRDSDGSNFDLLTRFINFGNFVTNTAGAIQMNYSESTPQYLEAPDRNALTVSLTGSDIGSNYEVQVLWSLMASWRYWIAQNSAFVDFFDLTLPNSGQSDEWMRYLRMSGFSLRVRCELVNDTGELFYFGSGINLQDYDDSPDITSSVEYYDSNGDQQQGFIANDIMTLRARHILNTGSWDQADVWGWNSIRPFESEPNKRISTEWDWTAQNYPLMPPTGEDRAILTFPTADEARVECRVNTSMINVQTSTPIIRIESPKDPTCISPVDYLIDLAIASSDSADEVPFTIDKFLENGVDAEGMCCPTCEVQLPGGSPFELYAFGTQTDVQALVATLDGDIGICCADEYGGVVGCEAAFTTEWDALMLAVSGNTAALTALVPSQINTYTNTTLAYLSSALQSSISDAVIRYQIIEVILTRGLKVTCIDGEKTISEI